MGTLAGSAGAEDGRLLSRRPLYVGSRFAFIALFLGLMVFALRRQPGHPDNASVAIMSVCLAAMLACVFSSQFRTQFDQQGIRRPFRRAIHWKDVVALSANADSVIIATRTAVCEIALGQFKEPMQLVDLVREHVPRDAMVTPVPRLWRLTHWR